MGQKRFMTVIFTGATASESGYGCIDDAYEDSITVKPTVSLMLYLTVHGMIFRTLFLLSWRTGWRLFTPSLISRMIVPFMWEEQKIFGSDCTTII